MAALSALIHSGRPLTSVDADPAKAQVIREFLLEVIGSGDDPRMIGRPTEPRNPAC
ncbi:hypothetical protein GCM10027614_38820 [Micromonospora vulcania]